MKIQAPQDLRALGIDELQRLAEDIRQEILSTCLKNGGHLGASLGTVELSLALHSIFKSPQEPILWDVGHQAYAHKLITGRWEQFKTLRLTGGISGFLSREESEHDVFGAGHSSTSVSAALAMAWARREGSDWTVAVIGDGGLTAGVALEALNNARGLDMGPLLVVLNDNQMSISPNVGAIPAILAEGRAASFFEHFGFDYVGPVDGHDLRTLIGTIGGIRASREVAGKDPSRRPILLHVLTQKGKGYIPAEEHPAAYHGISPVSSKLPEKPGTPKAKTYSDAFGEALRELAAKDNRILALTAAMPEGTGLADFARSYPDRFFDVGIAEPHAVTFAAGLATQGFRPVVAIYSTFLQRALDAIIHDVALQKLPVVFGVDRAGLVGADGPTHHGVFDLAYLGMIPGMTVACPSCLDDMPLLLKEASKATGPYAIRYPRGGGPTKLDVPTRGGLRWHQIARRPNAILVGLGAMAQRIAEVAKDLDPRAEQITAVSSIYMKPLPDSLVQYLNSHPQASLFFVEEGSVQGGFGQTVTSRLAAAAGRCRFLGYGDHFVPHGSISALEESEGLSTQQIRERVQSVLKK